MKIFPATVIVDTREQKPYEFQGIFAKPGIPLAVETIRAALPSGDYSLLGHESSVAIERKSLVDLYGTLGKGRDRFQREMERLQTYKFAAVVVECDWSTVLASPPSRSRMRPATVYRNCAAWAVKYGVHWWPTPNRKIAEITTFRFLEYYLRYYGSNNDN